MATAPAFLSFDTSYTLPVHYWTEAGHKVSHVDEKSNMGEHKPALTKKLNRISR